MAEEEAKNRKKMISKGLSKSMSSPSRAADNNKFPPPLMRFLRSSTSSKSRGRSKSSPLFIMRRKSATKTSSSIEPIQEPSSPKVTCIGQVRVRRSSSKSHKSTKPNKQQLPRRNNSSSSEPRLYNQTPCSWVRKALCCPRFRRPRFCFPNLCKWSLFSCSRCCCKKADSSRDGESSAMPDSMDSIPRFLNDIRNNDFLARISISEAPVEECTPDLSNSSPPKNALLLTRCRSAPYRSSSLASRFWGSPLKGENEEEIEDKKSEEEEEEGGGEEEGEEEEQGEEEQQQGEETKTVRVCNRNEEEKIAEPRFSSQSEEMERAVDERSKLAKSIHDMRAVGGAAVHPLLLTRCKSEPARTAAQRLLPDAPPSTMSKR